MGPALLPGELGTEVLPGAVLELEADPNLPVPPLPPLPEKIARFFEEAENNLQEHNEQERPTKQTEDKPSGAGKPPRKAEPPKELKIAPCSYKDVRGDAVSHGTYSSQKPWQYPKDGQETKDETSKGAAVLQALHPAQDHSNVARGLGQPFR